MVSTTSAGSELAVTIGVPATQTIAGYSALTYTEVGQIESIGAIGPSYEKIEFQPLKGAKQKHKGGVDYGSLTPAMAYDSADAGQTIVRTASDSQTALLAWRVTLPNGNKRYFQGRVFGFPEQIGAANTIVMVNPTIEIDTQPIRDPA